MKKKVENPPYDHELDSTESRCAKSCPACLWLEQFEATGDTRPSPISERPALTADELNARFERLINTDFGS